MSDDAAKKHQGTSGAEDATAAFAEFLRLRESGDTPDFDAFCERHPDCATELRALHAVSERLRKDDTIELVKRDIPSASSHRVGRYTILDTLGEGGMGVVYLAEQREPVRRRVALKLIKLGLESREIVARFEAERQALAVLHHPAIATVHDAGTANSGRPYFVMEYVEGLPIAEYSRRNSLSVERRLELFIQICHGIHHAHENGVIHRDVKPSNVLVSTVDARPLAKIIDFGVAKATNQRLTERTLYTEIGKIIGTPSYMSPEQAGRTAEDVDRRTDVYSLGVLLYELLVGEPPLDPTTLEKLDYDEIVRRIREDEPPTPSTRWTRLSADRRSRLAAERSTDPSIFAGKLRGDLDWIVMKALEKERSRRYPSAADIATDVERYLRGDPVAARPPSRIYKLRKVVRRNRGLVAAVTCVVAALTAGLFASLLLYGETRRALDEAEKQTRLAVFRGNRALLAAAASALEAGDPFALDEQLGAVDPEHRGWEWEYLRQSIDRSVSLFAPGEPIACAGFDDDGSRVILLTEGGRLVEYDALSGEELSFRRLEPRNVRAAAFSKGCALVATIHGEDARSVGLWTRAGEPKKALTAVLEETGTHVAISADGRWVVGSGKENAWRWDGAGPDVGLFEDVPETTGGRCLEFVPGGQLVILTGGRSVLAVYDLASRRKIRSSSAGTPTLMSLALSGDGSLIALGEGSHNAIYVRSTGGDREMQALLQGHREGAQSVAFSSDGKRLLSAGDRTVRLWDLHSGKPLSVLTGHAGTVRHAAFGPDGSYILSISDDGTARLWSVEGTDELRVRDVGRGHARGMAFSSDGVHVVAATWQGVVSLWDAVTAEIVIELSAVPREIGDNGVHSVNISAGGRYVATGHANGVVRLHDLIAHETVGAVQKGAKRVYSVVFSPDDQRLLSSSGRALFSHSVPDLEELAAGRVDSTIDNFDVSPDGRTLVASTGRRVLILDADHLDIVKELGRHDDDGEAVTFNRDGSLVAGGSDGGEIAIWSTNDRSVERRFGGHPERIYCVSFSADSSRLAAGTDKGTISLWDVSSGEEVARLRGHHDNVYELEFSPVAPRLVSASGDGFLRFWDTEPDWKRRQARHRRARRREAVTPRVRELAEQGTGAMAVERVRSDTDLDDLEKSAAWQVLLRRAADRKVSETRQTNIARWKSTNQSSYVPRHPTEYAVDKQLDNYSITSPDDTLAVWEVDLGESFRIERVIVHNRGDKKYASRLRDIVISLHDRSFREDQPPRSDPPADGEPVWPSALWESTVLNPENALGGGGLDGPASLEVTLEPPVSGRFVRVKRIPDPDLSGSGGEGEEGEANVLGIGEVEVFAAGGAAKSEK